MMRSKRQSRTPRSACVHPVHSGRQVPRRLRSSATARTLSSARPLLRGACPAPPPLAPRDLPPVRPLPPLPPRASSASAPLMLGAASYPMSCVSACVAPKEVLGGGGDDCRRRRLRRLPPPASLSPPFVPSPLRERFRGEGELAYGPCASAPPSAAGPRPPPLPPPPSPRARGERRRADGGA